MTKAVAVRREVIANEQRAPLCPSHVTALRAAGARVIVGPSPERVFHDDEYRAAGAEVSADLADCSLVLGIKELPADRLMERKVHAFFSHTIKGQPKNMPMLLHMIERECTLIDYERITDDKGRRLVFFGQYAGLAGMIDSLWALGARLAQAGLHTPLARLKTAYRYASIDEAMAEVRSAGQALAQMTLLPHLTPLVIGVAGTGNVAQGVQRVLEALGTKPLRAPDLAALPAGPGLYHVTFSEQHFVEPRLGFYDPASFDVQEYYDRPGRYRGVFERYLPYLNVLMNCIYWDSRYPRLVTVEGLRQLFDGHTPPRLQVIGDISCDVRGAIEATTRATKPTNPVYVYDTETGQTPDGVAGTGPVILAVYNLPSEFPREASQAFGDALMPFVAPMLTADYDAPFERCGLPDPLRRATVLFRGALTPGYQYLEDYL
jgi:alpha-aminoadipic semialdehyde synthase